MAKIEWPSKDEGEDWQITGFIDAYKQLSNGRLFIVESKRERPDYILRDQNSGERFFVELTSVYLDDRSVPDVHMLGTEGLTDIPYDEQAIEQYKKRLIGKLCNKVSKAMGGYDTTYPLILGVYVNEYISIYMDEPSWQEFVKDYEEVFDSMAPFSEVVFWPLPNEGVFSVRPSAEQLL